MSGIILTSSSGRYSGTGCLAWQLGLQFRCLGRIKSMRRFLPLGTGSPVSAFMITGPATKITNLGALKIVLGMRRFALYLAFVMLFSLATGLLVNLVMPNIR